MPKVVQYLQAIRRLLQSMLIDYSLRFKVFVKVCVEEKD
jgi:hypothetical protein